MEGALSQALAAVAGEVCSQAVGQGKGGTIPNLSGQAL